MSDATTPTPLIEADGTVLVEAVESGIADVTLITPGQGSSGEYPADVLEAAASDGVFAAGTHMYLDHPTPGERPERSLDRLAGVLTEDATWDGSALKAKARIFPRFRTMLAEMQDAIGVSIRAGGVIESGVVKKIGPVASVDFVTKPGRGGTFALVESAIVMEAHGLTANELSAALDKAVRDAYAPGGDAYVWVRDYTDTWVVYSLETPDSRATTRESYTVDQNGVVSLAGDGVEVVERSTFVPVSESTPIHDAIPAVVSETPADVAGQPASTPAAVPTEESQEDTMIDLTEAEVQTLREAADQLPTVTAERDAARAELAARDRRDAARPIVEAALADANIPTRARTRLVESLLKDVPATTDGALDEAAFKTVVEAAKADAEAEAAEVLAESGYGQVRGLGAARVTESADITPEYASIYGTEA